MGQIKQKVETLKTLRIAFQNSDYHPYREAAPWSPVR